MAAPSRTFLRKLASLSTRELCKNQLGIICCSKFHTSTIKSEDASKSKEPAKRSQKISRAMLTYLKKAQEHEKIMEEQTQDYEMGRRHLANIMGVDQEEFTQEHIDKAISYLLPSSLHDKKALPLLKHPSEAVIKKRAAAYDYEGRPHHHLFYTMKPLYYGLMHEISEKVETLKEEYFKKNMNLSTREVVPLNLSTSKWIDAKTFKARFPNEPVDNDDYRRFILIMDRLSTLRLARKEYHFIMKFREELVRVQEIKVPELLIEENTDRKYSEDKEKNMPRLKKKTNSQRLSLDRRRKRTGQDDSYSECPDGGIDDSTLYNDLGTQDNDDDSYSECPDGGIDDSTLYNDLGTQGNDCLEFGIHEESFHGISPDDVMDGELEIQILDYSSQILKTQFNVTHGLHLPSFLYALEKSKRTCSKIPNSASNVVQIHIIPGHYLISVLQNGQLHVYDSLYNRQHVLQLIPQLNLLYDTHVVNNLQYSCPQSQGFSVLCGFYAVANTVSCLLGEPLGGTPLDASKMRKHLRECLMNGTFQAFPRVMPTVLHTSNEQISTFTLTAFNASSKFEIELQKEFERYTLVRKRRCSNTRVKADSLKQMKVNSILKQMRSQTTSFKDDQKKKDVRKENEEKNVIVNNQDQIIEKTTKECLSFQKDTLDVENRERIKEKDKIRKRTERKNMSKKRKIVCLNRDRLRHREKRENMTEEERETKHEENRLQHQKQRGNFTIKERGEKRKADRIQHQKRRENLTKEERGNKRDLDRLQHQKQREILTDEERGNKREKNKLQHQKEREHLTKEQRGNKRDGDRIQHQKQREKLTEEERGNKREKNRLQHQKQRENLTEEEKGNKLDGDRIQHQKQREKLTEEERGNKREENRLQQQKQRKNLTEEEKGNKREENRLQHQKQRENLTEEEKGNKREENRLQHQKQRENLTEEERGRKREKDTQQHKTQRQNLCGSKRNEVREKDRVHKKRKKAILFPLSFTDLIKDVDIHVTTWGGGPSGQAMAIRFALAKALKAHTTAEVIERMKYAGLLTKDTRRKERKKPGQHKARKEHTWKAR